LVDAADHIGVFRELLAPEPQDEFNRGFQQPSRAFRNAAR
jgi:hypothetical protein